MAVQASSEELDPSQVSVAIAGGGIIGMAAAWRLAQHGFPVSVFDKGAIGGEASWAGAGMLAPGGECEEPCELTSLLLKSRGQYSGFVKELVEETGLSIDYQECGALELAYSPEELRVLDNRAVQQTHLGIGWRRVSVAEVATLCPKVRTPGLEGAWFYPSDGFVNPRDVLVALAGACRRRNVSIHQGCAVLSAKVGSERVMVASAEGAGHYDALIVAAGAWSNSFPVEGVPPLPTVEPVKGHLIGYQQPERVASTIIRHGDNYLLQRRNGLLIAGSSLEHVGFEREIDSAVAARLASNAAEILPHLRDIPPTEVWNGFRPASDTLHISSWHSSRLLLAYGHYRNGILLAPVTAQKLVETLSASLQRQWFACSGSR